MAKNISALDLAHKFLKEHLKEGDICVDATVGRGNDTAFLCSLVGKRGRVVGFDIQESAITSAKELLQKQGYTAELHLESHSSMASYLEEDTLAAIIFNFGWLPGGDHSIFTKANSSIAAIEAGLKLLKSGGIMSLCIYYGKDSGYEEKDALMEYLPTLDYDKYTVLITEFVNRPNEPPIPVQIFKH